MGKIHDALQKAEEERSALGGVPQGPASTSEFLETPAAPSRGEQLRDGRRSRVITSGVESAASEEFRSLRARIQSLRRNREIRSLVITSARPAEGKTTTATNLALSFGLELEGSTCLLDADLRAPGVHKAFPDQPQIGLAEVLETDTKFEDALINVPDTRLSVLPVGALPSYPSELLASRKMRELLDELHIRFSLVIVDAPPILGLPDTTGLVDLCDATLLVVSADETPRNLIETALDRIDAGKVIGTVFNRFDARTEPYGYGRSK